LKIGEAKLLGMSGDRISPAESRDTGKETLVRVKGWSNAFASFYAVFQIQTEKVEKQPPYLPPNLFIDLLPPSVCFLGS